MVRDKESKIAEPSGPFRFGAASGHYQLHTLFDGFKSHPIGALHLGPPRLGVTNLAYLSQY